MAAPAFSSVWAHGSNAAMLQRASALVEQFAGETLRVVPALRSEFPKQSAPAVSRAVEFALARCKVQAYGEWTRAGLFTRQSAEQATAPAVAEHHASRFVGCRSVLEICTGAGFDTAALARVVRRVVSIEADAELAELARHNLAVQGIYNVDVLTGRAEDVLPALSMDEFDGLWADPSRRTSEGQRIVSPEDYAPPLPFVVHVARSLRCGIKLAPTVDIQLPHQWRREWIGYAGECREQLLWLHTPVVDNTVSLVDAGVVFEPSRLIQRSDLVLRAAPEALAGQWLVEPHNAVVRSGALHSLYADKGVALLDEHIAYGVSAHQLERSPLYSTFLIVEAFAWNEKKLRQRLRELQWGSGTQIKKRGFPQTPEQVRARLALPRGGTAGTVVLTRVGQGHIVLLCERTKGPVSQNANESPCPPPML